MLSFAWTGAIRLIAVFSPIKQTKDALVIPELNRGRGCRRQFEISLCSVAGTTRDYFIWPPCSHKDYMKRGCTWHRTLVQPLKSPFQCAYCQLRQTRPWACVFEMHRRSLKVVGVIEGSGHRRHSFQIRLSKCFGRPRPYTVGGGLTFRRHTVRSSNPESIC